MSNPIFDDERSNFGREHALPFQMQASAHPFIGRQEPLGHQSQVGA